MNQSPAGAVVVGLDPSPNARAALHWAASEAASRCAVLRIGYAWSVGEYDVAGARSLHMEETARKAAVAFLDQAAQEARSTHPGLTVETELIEDAPVEGLLRLAANADLVTVGRRGLNSFLAFLLGSVSQGVVAHTPVPAVVVPQEPAVPGGPVVVGVAPGEPEPVEFAFTEAERRGVPLQVVRSWLWPQAVPGYIPVPPVEEAERDAEESAELETLLARSRQAHPQVEVTIRVGLSLPEEVLVDASERACLVVVGAHRRHTRFGLPIGRVPHRVLHLAKAPVAVVPRAREARPPQGS
jgi:nucleotide-binding universal stress UspA family protein